jgi:hypothetical protein
MFNLKKTKRTAPAVRFVFRLAANGPLHLSDFTFVFFHFRTLCQELLPEKRKAGLLCFFFSGQQTGS